MNNGRINGIAFLADAAGVLSAGDDEAIRLWPAAEPPVPALVEMAAHGDSAFAVAFSRNGKLLATGGKDKLVALRNPETGEILRTLPGHVSLVYEVAFSPDSKLLASASADGNVRLWSVEKGQSLATWKAWKFKAANIRTVAFSPDNRTVASGASDGTLRLFDAVEKKQVRDLVGQALPVTSAQFSPDSSLLATSTGDWQNWRLPGELRLWDVKSGEELASLPGHAGEIKRVAFSPSGNRMASAAAGGFIFVWDLDTRKPVAQFRPGTTPTAIVFVGSDDRLAIGGAPGDVLLWDISRQSVARRYRGHDKLVSGMAVSPDGRRLATAAHDGTLKIWPLAE
jgi:WD40 repeat protein